METQREQMYVRRKSRQIPEFTELLPLPNTPLDCTLVTEGGTYFSAHRAVLSAYSPYLETQLSNRMEDHPIIFLEHVKSKDMEGIMNYIYHGELSIPERHAEEFLRTARMLQIKGLADNGYGDMVVVQPEPAVTPPPPPPAVPPQRPSKTWTPGFLKNLKDKRKKKEEKAKSKSAEGNLPATMNQGAGDNQAGVPSPEQDKPYTETEVPSEPLWDNYEPIVEKLLPPYRKPFVKPVELAKSDILRPPNVTFQSTVLNKESQMERNDQEVVQTSPKEELRQCPDCHASLNCQLPTVHSTYFRCRNSPDWEAEGGGVCKECGAQVAQELVELHVKHLCGRRVACLYCQEAPPGDWVGHVTKVHGKSVSAVLRELAQMDERDFLSKIRAVESPQQPSPPDREVPRCRHSDGRWKPTEIMGAMAVLAMGHAVVSGNRGHKQ